MIDPSLTPRMRCAPPVPRKPHIVGGHRGQRGMAFLPNWNGGNVAWMRAAQWCAARNLELIRSRGLVPVNVDRAGWVYALLPFLAGGNEVRT